MWRTSESIFMFIFGVAVLFAGFAEAAGRIRDWRRGEIRWMWFAPSVLPTNNKARRLPLEIRRADKPLHFYGLTAASIMVFLFCMVVGVAILHDLVLDFLHAPNR